MPFIESSFEKLSSLILQAKTEESRGLIVDYLKQQLNCC